MRHCFSSYVHRETHLTEGVKTLRWSNSGFRETHTSLMSQQPASLSCWREVGYHVRLQLPKPTVGARWVISGFLVCVRVDISMRWTGRQSVEQRVDAVNECVGTAGGSRALCTLLLIQEKLQTLSVRCSSWFVERVHSWSLSTAA